MHSNLENQISKDRKIVESFKNYLTVVKNWIDELIKQYFFKARPITELGFKRIPQYFPEELLNSVKVVVVDKVPKIPLSSMGIKEFEAFEKIDTSALTYRDIIFVGKNYAELESLYFHELIHILQWKHLGTDKFLLLYGLGILKNNYWNNPLETLAYSQQEDFESLPHIWDVKKMIIPIIDQMTVNLFK